MSTESLTIYVQLLNEGTTVYRPVRASVMGHGLFKLNAHEGYDPEDEKWEFLPGSIVECRAANSEEKEILVAARISNDGSEE